MDLTTGRLEPSCRIEESPFHHAADERKRRERHPHKQQDESAGPEEQPEEAEIHRVDDVA